MAYEVLARKWRPRQFNDVVGQEHVTKTLANAIESGRVAHAYLFVGPRGIGKTTLSRIFAKALNCEHGPTTSPCDECENCREIMGGTSIDVFEIDAASNNGVDNIRSICEQANYTPSHCKYKIFIVDEVHMLSTGAFNALLKTLEEPPPHVKFIFATTEIDKLPATIISRCQRFDLRRIPTSLIVKFLGDIARREGAEISDDALLAIARGAEGGMRDALSALDQIISFKGTHITEDDVIAVFGLVSRSQLENLAKAILTGDMAAGLKIINDLDSSGKDLRRLTVELISHFRNILVLQQLGDAAAGALDTTEEQMKSLSEQARLVDSSRVLRVTEQLTQLEDKIRFALSRRICFETVFLRCCRAATTVTLDQVIRQLSAIQDAIGGGELPPPVAIAQARPQPNLARAPATRAVAESKTQPPPRPATPAQKSTPPPPRPVAPPASNAAPPSVPKTKPISPTAKPAAETPQSRPATPPVDDRPHLTREETSKLIESPGVKSALKMFGGFAVDAK